MSVRHLDRLLEPGSVAVIGASDRPGSVGAMVWPQPARRRLRRPLYAVNPKHDTAGRRSHAPTSAMLPQAPDLAVICTPPATGAGTDRRARARAARARRSS